MSIHTMLVILQFSGWTTTKNHCVNFETVDIATPINIAA